MAHVGGWDEPIGLMCVQSQTTDSLVREGVAEKGPRFPVPTLDNGQAARKFHQVAQATDLRKIMMQPGMAQSGRGATDARITEPPATFVLSHQLEQPDKGIGLLLRGARQPIGESCRSDPNQSRQLSLGYILVAEDVPDQFLKREDAPTSNDALFMN
jgi:hypothetical protein